MTVLDEALSFWGGVDPITGRIIDKRHPQVHAQLAGRVLVMPSGRGSSSSSSILAEAVRRGTAPAGIVLRTVDAILLMGAVVAHELYGGALPIVILDGPEYAKLRSGGTATIEAGNDGARILYQMPPNRGDVARCDGS